MKLQKLMKPNWIALIFGLTACQPASKSLPPNDADRVHSHGYDIRVLDRTDDAAHHPDLVAWTKRAAEADSETTGGARWPIELIAESGRRGAVTNGSRITIHFHDGPRPPPGDEWVLHHELIHASFPSLADDDRWLEEGLATYLEPFVRARVGQVTPAAIWRDIARDLPQGAPQAGERGLRGTWAWHRLYWGGCVFWLASAMEVDRQTQGKKSLSDALCAWAKATSAETPEAAFAAMDAALGQPILAPRYARASARGLEDDPKRMLTELGVSLRGEEVVFTDTAPAAKLRVRLTERGQCVR